MLLRSSVPSSAFKVMLELALIASCTLQYPCLRPRDTIRLQCDGSRGFSHRPERIPNTGEMSSNVCIDVNCGISAAMIDSHSQTA